VRGNLERRSKKKDKKRNKKKFPYKTGGKFRGIKTKKNTGK
jgi:hypothetical protein